MLLALALRAAGVGAADADADAAGFIELLEFLSDEDAVLELTETGGIERGTALDDPPSPRPQPRTEDPHESH
ncbi:MAG: hypothetical protein ACT4PG_06475 [Panacagrimonas sp.]